MDQSAVTFENRVQSARLMLLRLRAHTSDPVWSSFLIKKMVDGVVSLPGGHVGDLIYALYLILGECSVELNSVTENFILQIVQASFIEQRAIYKDFDWSLIKGGRKDSPAQKYLVELAT